MKIYLDTCVIGYLDQRDDPIRMAETRRLWHAIQAGEYEAVISDTTYAELDECHEPKRSILMEYLHAIPFTVVPSNQLTDELAEKFIALGILRQKSYDDCVHIASAITSGCDAIVSWNFKHIVNHATVTGVKRIISNTDYKDILIYTPQFLTGGDPHDSF
ncbi:MAG: PIN domain-containing protein [Firmicutes bacterium]|nr:PIN domain-containing protein [Bacillota bacterium]